MNAQDIPKLEAPTTSLFDLLYDMELQHCWTKASVVARDAYLRELNEKLGIHLVGLELAMGELSRETDLIYAKRLQKQIDEVLSHE